MEACCDGFGEDSFGEQMAVEVQNRHLLSQIAWPVHEQLGFGSGHRWHLSPNVLHVTHMALNLLYPHQSSKPRSPQLCLSQRAI